MKKTKRVWLAVDEEIHDKVVSIADMEDRTIHGQYRRLITEALEQSAARSFARESERPTLDLRPKGKLTERILIRVDDELRREVTEIANLEGRTFHSQFRMLCEVGLAVYRQGKPAAKQPKLLMRAVPEVVLQKVAR